RWKRNPKSTMPARMNSSTGSEIANSINSTPRSLRTRPQRAPNLNGRIVNLLWENRHGEVQASFRSGFVIEGRELLHRCGTPMALWHPQRESDATRKVPRRL